RRKKHQPWGGVGGGDQGGGRVLEERETDSGLAGEPLFLRSVAFPLNEIAQFHVSRAVAAFFQELAQIVGDRRGYGRLLTLDAARLLQRVHELVRKESLP